MMAAAVVELSQEQLARLEKALGGKLEGITWLDT